MEGTYERGNELKSLEAEKKKKAHLRTKAASVATDTITGQCNTWIKDLAGQGNESGFLFWCNRKPLKSFK